MGSHIKKQIKSMKARKKYICMISGVIVVYLYLQIISKLELGPGFVHLTV